MSKTQGHASFDMAQRRHKAEKIIRILECSRPLHDLHVLEIGTGSGIIAASLAERAGPNGGVTSVDVVDRRIALEGYRFLRVEGARLPFPDASFDAVVSNHVIEHVGDRLEQLTHLREIRRVLRADGAGYIAAPNRWAVVEPHYRLPLLSWLPRRLADAYMRSTGKGSAYDCFPPGPLGLRRAMRSAGLRWSSKAGQAVHAMAELEGGRGLRAIAALVPAAAFDVFSGLLPTMVFIVERS